MITLYIIIIATFAYAIIVGRRELKNAINVDPKEPFLSGDYDESTDPTLKKDEPPE